MAAPGVSAQNPTTLAGTITSSAGGPLFAASVLIPSMNIGVATNSQGRYVLIVPAARATGQTVSMTVNMIGRASQTVAVTLSPGTQEFNFILAEDPLLLDEIVVTGLGLDRQRAKLGVTINTVRADEIAMSHEPNIVAAGAGVSTSDLAAHVLGRRILPRPHINGARALGGSKPPVNFPLDRGIAPALASGARSSAG